MVLLLSMWAPPGHEKQVTRVGLLFAPPVRSQLRRPLQPNPFVAPTDPATTSSSRAVGLFATLHQFRSLIHFQENEPGQRFALTAAINQNLKDGSQNFLLDKGQIVISHAVGLSYKAGFFSTVH